jgi:hypothetical protein
MESILIPKRKTERTKSQPPENLDNIIQEYCLKRNQFDPRKSSPDMFNKKLQHRMKLYYNTLYTLSSSPNKY